MPTSPRASASDLPCSVVSRTASASLFLSIASASRRSIVARSAAGVARQPSKAVCAAAIARRVSAAPQFGTVPITAPVAGLVTWMVLPLSAPTQSPPIRLESRWKGSVPAMGSSAGCGLAGPPSPLP